MGSYNKVTLVGNLTRDPEMRYTQSGTAVCEFSLAINESFKGRDGQQTEKVHYIDIVAWAKTAEVAAQYLKKGQQVLIDGKLTQDRWQDQASGQNRSKIRVTCERLVFLEKRDNSQGNQGGGGEQVQGGENQGAGVGDESDIPF